MTVYSRNSSLLQYKSIISETYFIIIKAEKKFLKFLLQSEFLILGTNKQYKYLLVEYVFPFWKWCKSLRLPEDTKIPRIPISQGLAILISWKLIEKEWKLRDIEYYESDLDEIQEVEDLIDEGRHIDAIKKIYYDNLLFSNIRSIVLFKNDKQITIDTVHSLIKIFDQKQEITEEKYSEVLWAINNAIPRMIM